MANFVPRTPPAELAQVGSSRLSDSAKTYARASKSDNTLRAYRAQLKLWVAFAKRHDIAELPADPFQVANWLAQRADEGRAYSTLRTGLAAIRAASVASGLPFDSGHPAIETVLKGIGRTNARAQFQAEPLRGADVLDLLAQLTPAPLDLRDGALLALGYIFAARRSELVGLDFGALGEGDGFVEITAREITMTMVRGKTVAVGEPQMVSVPRMTNSTAVSAIEAWIETANVGLGGAILRAVSKGGGISDKRLHAQSVALIVKRRVAEFHERMDVPISTARTEGKRFSGHSLRVGVAVTAAEAGADPRQIAQLGRWKSMEMPARYARRAEEAKTSPHLLPGVGLK